MLRAEAALDRELSGLALCQPRVIAKSAIRPEVDIGAIAFFKKFDARKSEILAADELEAIKIAYRCIEQPDFFRFWRAINEVNAFETAPKFGEELIAIRAARKAIRWIETSGLLKEAEYDG